MHNIFLINWHHGWPVFIKSGHVQNIRPFKEPLWTLPKVLNICHLLNSDPDGRFHCILEPSKNENIEIFWKF